ncbi:MAG TPA: D-alanyl-D-alanine carboxypeptidase [Rhodospirillales bacterium]|nr:D-alanyl-D-alanine carboxypeptidase [Rhodospirillales bacterium]
MSFAFPTLARRSLPLLAVAFLLAQPVQSRAIETIAREAVMIDMQTGTLLLDKNATVSMPPASMSKLMTVYMVFERLRDGRLSLDDSFTVSENAWRKGGTKSGSSTMFLEPGKRVRVEDLLRGIIVQSGNDACIVVAEALSGSEEAFAAEMTEKAREIGLLNSTFANATGWPDENQRMTALDLALLARKTIQEFPEYYHYYSEKSFVYNGIKQSNRNPLLYKDMGADGLKTGHTVESGYGLTGTAIRDGRRLILVVNGLPSKKARSREPERLLEWGFREFDNYALLKAGDKIEDAMVWLGKEATVPLIVENDLTVTLAKKSRRNMKATVTYEGPVPAPITKGTRLATLIFTAPETEPISIPLVAANDVEQLGLVGRLMAAFQSIVWGGS